ncbi:conserved hypothetical protein [Paraburkholderia caribensis]|nr:conserved hypothetical protein [Paraburkholderia caribensis]
MFCGEGVGFEVAFAALRGFRGAGWVGVLAHLLRFVVCASPFGVSVFAFAGIRVTLSRFRRRPCAGRHLLFFAAAKKSRQKKAAHTASP